MAQDINEELEQLRQLHDTGALSDDEFRRAKAAVLRENPAPDSETGAEDTEARPKRSRKRNRLAQRGTLTSGNGLYRDSVSLVIREGAGFPARCVICNKECDGLPLDFTFGREKKSHYIEVAAVQALARAAEDLVKGSRYTGPVQAAIPLCSWHRNRQIRRMGFGVVTMVLAVAYLTIRYSIGGAREFQFLHISISNVIAILAALVGLTIACASVVDRSKVWFKPTKYYDRFVWIKGAGRESLHTLPKIEEYHYNPDSDNPNLDAGELIRRSKR